MKALYHIPSLDNIYAGRTIFNGYKNAFTDLGHEFLPLTADDSFVEVVQNFQPDIFITSLNSLYLRYLDLDALKKARQQGLKVAVNIPFWQSPLSKLRVNESGSLADNEAHLKLIKSDNYGDIYFNSLAQSDPRMDGFSRGTGRPYLTVPLAADKIVLAAGKYQEKFKSDIAYIGTYLPEKRAFFKRYVFPLRRKYSLKLYGQDWSFYDRLLGLTSKVGQYYNIKSLAAIQKPKLQLTDEADIYVSSQISINVHEDYQKKFGGDCNERTFKIPFCGGFEITDNVACIGDYLKDGVEVVIAKNKDDWYDKINYFLTHPAQRGKIIAAGKRRVEKEHTYHNRVEQIIKALK